MPEVTLGTLERGWLSDLWKREDSHFTPWLASESNIKLLAKALGLEQLEEVQTEVPVGDFRLDILAEDRQSGSLVAVENQFWTGDHKHLGQLLTYAAGVSRRPFERKLFVWIAESLKAEHRSALDWLNQVTESNIGFFGIELELWRIGMSPFAPKFNVVCEPDNWQRLLSQQAQSLSPTYAMYQEFWQQFVSFCGPNSALNEISAKAEHWIPAFAVRPGFGVNLNARKRDRKLECQLWVEHPKAQQAFSALQDQGDRIKSELGSGTVFDGMGGRPRFKIYETHEADITDRNQWPEMHGWLKERGEAYVRVLSPLVRGLNLS